MATRYNCVKAENQRVIGYLQNELDRRSRRTRAPQVELPFMKAMKSVAKLPIVITNKWHALALDNIGADLATVCVDTDYIICVYMLSQSMHAGHSQRIGCRWRLG